MSRKLYAIIRSPIGYFEVAPAGFLPAWYNRTKQSPNATGAQGFIEIATGTLTECRRGMVELNKTRALHAPKELSMEEVLVVLRKKKEIETYVKRRSIRMAVSRAFKNRDAHMDQPKAWRACAIALRRQADADRDAGYGTMAKAVRSDAWDADETALRLETHNNRESMMAFREYRLRLEATGK